MGAFNVAARLRADTSTSPAWPAFQASGLLAGVVLWVLLLVKPGWGLPLVWNVLIPLTPALLVIAPGGWRNVCPLATLSLLPAHLGLSAGLRPSPRAALVLELAGVAGLFGLIPLRHVLLNHNGTATALMLGGAGVAALIGGGRSVARGGWCTHGCPIHAVERLLGERPAVTLANARCGTCRRCVAVCPDSTPGMNPLVTRRGAERLMGHLFVGSFVGFIFGWNQVVDVTPGVTLSWAVIRHGYAWPWGSALVTLALYAGLRWRWPKATPRLFALAAVCTYYWYRLPALAGFGPPQDTSALVDLRAYPALPITVRLVSVCFFGWWWFRRAPRRAWSLRPPVASGQGERGNRV